MARSVVIDIETTYTCDADGVTQAIVSGTDLPNGWKRLKVPPTTAERVLGIKTKEVYLCPTSLASNDPQILQAIRNLITSE